MFEYYWCIRNITKHKRERGGKKMKRRFIGLLLALMMIASSTGCSDKLASSKSEETEAIRLMVWSPSEDQSRESGEWLQKTCEKFDEMHQEWDITFVYGVADEATAASQVSQDPEASADVFMYANDTLTVMTDANSLAKFGGKYADEIKKTNSKEVLNSLTMDEAIYGVPFTTNTWYMYYDKNVFSENDVQNLDVMLEKGVVSFPFTNSWYLPSFYVGNGCTLFGDGTEEEKGVDFSGEKAAEVTNYLIDLAENPNFKIDADGSGIAGLRDGSINAMFSGSWDAGAIKTVLGENMGVAALPKYTLNGEEKQMKSYAGTKAVGVNTSSKHMVASVELALYLASAESQKTHYEMRNVIPCNTELLKDEAIAKDVLVQAQNDTFNRTSILQPFVAGMNNCWTPVENMGKAIRNKSITHEDAAEQTEAMNQAMNHNGL